MERSKSTDVDLLRVLADQIGAGLTHSTDIANLDTFDDGGRGQGRRAAPL